MTTSNESNNLKNDTIFHPFEGESLEKILS